ncbi:MAG: hypothetical protein IKW98_11920 [Prevotella sp.]|nr:hypothetical protein [Prevotella sp.]
MNHPTQRPTHVGRKTALVASFLLFVLAFWNCTSDNYDTGDGDYSYLRAEFVMSHVANDSTVDYAIDDNNSRINIDKPFKARWTTTTDSLYRALLYFNDKPEGAEVVKMTQVYVLQPLDTSKVKKPIFDPVTFESSWISANGSFLNFSFYVKTGKSDDEDARQSIGVLTETNEDGVTVLTLLHDQGDIPQYYSNRVYASIPLTDELRQSHLRLVVNTYTGQSVKDFPPSTTAH